MKNKRPHKRYEKVCPNCNEKFIGKYEQECCDRSCAMKLRYLRGKAPPVPVIKTKEERKKHSKKVGESLVNKRGRKNVKSIYEVSSRTRRKILTRLELSCSRCGWSEGTCDLHHINGRKIKDCDNHKNLSLICPNCHRLVHEGKILKEELKNLKETFPKDWKKSFYG